MVLVQLSKQSLPPFFCSMFTNWDVFSRRRSVLEWISGALLGDWPQNQALYSHWFPCAVHGCFSLDVSDGPFLLLAEDEPPHSTGLTLVHAICMKVSDNGGGKWAERFEYRMLRDGGLAGCEAFSKPPTAIGGVSWCPADWMEWLWAVDNGVIDIHGDKCGGSKWCLQYKKTIGQTGSSI